MSKTALILRHISVEGPGSFVKIFEEQDIACNYVTAPRSDLSKVDVISPDYLIVMGGPIGVYDAPDYPFLNQEIELIQKRLESGKPILAVCLGAQLLAKALGADVYKGPEKEIGWGPIVVTDAGKNSPARHLDASQTNMFHWHGDTFDLPEGATLLASSDAYANQIFSYGENVMALQCHAEVTDELLQEWFVMLTGEIKNSDTISGVSELRQQTADLAPKMEEQARKFLTEWLGQVE